MCVKVQFWQILKAVSQLPHVLRLFCTMGLPQPHM
jgi:hypothetical protein